MTPWLIILALAALVAVLFWPGQGLVRRWRRMRELTARMLREDALKHIHKARINGRRPTLESIAGTLHLGADQAAALLGEMERRGLMSFASGEIRLTPSGEEAALHIIRAHRLWESYLAEQTGVAENEWHTQAEDQEHHLSPAQTQALSAQLGHPTHDPHGDPIPAAGGLLAAHGGAPLNLLEPGQPALITHIEDEPVTVYAQIAAQGLRPGMRIRVLDKEPQSIRFWADGNEHVLAPILAHNIAAAPLAEQEIEEEPTLLSSLQPGQKARVLGLSRACRGMERRRLLDLGFVPGSEVEAEMISPTGDPTAFRVRGALIALRREQSDLIRVANPEPVTG